jgi:putative hemolysin
MIEIAIVAGLILLNGLFALSELAIVSARKPRLRTLVAQNRSGAATALSLAENPGKFLSTVQIGITLIGIIAGAFSGATLGGRLGVVLLDLGLAAHIAMPLGYGAVVVIITYFSVVVGELVPKQLALRNAEAIACAVAPLMKSVSIGAAPAVWVLDASTRLIFRLMGRDEVAEEIVTEEEIKALVAEAAATGVIESAEKQMIAGVLRLSDRKARAIMTPRTDIDMINLRDDPAAIAEMIAQTRHSRLPVADGDPDNMIGIIVIRDYLRGNRPSDVRGLRRLIRSAPVVPDTLPALDVLDTLRKSDHPLALVHDEYGHFEGVVTPADLLEAIAGIFRSDIDEVEDEEVVERADGSFLLPGGITADAMADALAIQLPTKRDYHTAAGFVIATLRHLPTTGEAFDALGWHFEVVDMDGRRIDKLLATRITPPIEDGGA